MNNIKVTLLHQTPLYIASNGARTCWASQDKSDTVNNAIGPKDLELLDRVGNKFHHASILEHITFNFFIDGISRACLQELARHRIASLSVKSSRYTLKELKAESAFVENYGHLLINDSNEYISTSGTLASKFLFITGNSIVDGNSIRALENLRLALVDGISNDIAKYCMPEAYRTQLTWSINLRSLQNFLFLRTDKTALPEIQHLAHLIYNSLPTDTKSLLEHCIKDNS